MIARHYWVTGRVQGVGFRYSARITAIRLGLAGWCRNLPDGRVEVLTEGNESDSEEFLAWLKRGPPGSRVDQVTIELCPCAGVRGFDIRR